MAGWEERASIFHRFFQNEQRLNTDRQGPTPWLFISPSMSVNMSLVDSPTAITPAIKVSRIAANITAYSTAVAASSLFNMDSVRANRNTRISERSLLALILLINLIPHSK
jgi:hypothetical protein